MKIKICGITNTEDARVAWESGADALGFILYAQSPRYVDPQIVKAIVSGLPPFIVSVGVFVNESSKTVQNIMEKCGLTYAQLHGDETPEYCETLDRPILKALRLKDRSSFLSLAEYRGRAGVKGFVVDTFSESSYGGTGQTTNWSLAAEVAEAAPILLAGGLTPENVQEAIAQVHPYGVDVSSGVEVRPGKKDHDKVRTFIHAVQLVS
jgi:phosphoribosylanthranilate isomerase